MQRAIDTVAIEVERVSESQRFIARLLAERGERQSRTEGSNEGNVRDRATVDDRARVDEGEENLDGKRGT